MKYILSCSVIILLLVFSIDLRAKQAISEQTLKSAFIGQFTHYIDWPSPLTNYKIAYLGSDDAYWQALQAMAAANTAKKPINLTRISKAEQILLSNAHILVIAQSHNRYLAGINALIGDKATLLVSESISDNKLIGINFYKTPEQTLSFSLNRYNLLYQGLSVNEDIILLGGSEIDVAHLVKEMSSKLSESSELISKLNVHIANQEKEIQKKQQQLAGKQANINAKNLELTNLTDKVINTQSDYEQQLKTLSKQLKDQETVLTNKQSEVDKTQIELDKIKNQSAHFQNLITSNQQHIEQQTKKLSSLSEQLSSKEQALQAKDKQVKQTTNVLFISIAALIVFIILAVNLWYLSNRKQALNKILESHNDELEHINEQLLSTQKQLVESEKMASLAGLVTGVAHEVNTPLGASITAVTHLSAISAEAYSDFKEKKLSSQKFERIIEEQLQATEIIFKNLCRAAELIKSFKQVSADQVSEAAREFEINDYLYEIKTSLKHKLKQAQVSVEIECDFEKQIYSYPGVFSQIISNLIINSLVHGFKSQTGGKITLSLRQEHGHIYIDYRDNGKGIQKENLEKVFDPFFTTNRNSGSTGLGLSICYNLVTQKMQGNIICLESDQGVHFELSFPFKIHHDE